MGLKRGKAQVSVEFLMVVLFAFLLIVPLTIYYVDQSGSAVEEVNTAQMSKIARSIASNAETVYAYGEPTTFTMNVYIPEKVKGVHLNNSDIIFTLEKDGSNFSVSELVTMNISGSFNTTPGAHRIRVQAVGGSVLVTEVIG